MNKQVLIKLAQVNLAAKHVLRTRIMQKQAGTMMDIRQATPDEEEIAKLKKIRDSYGLWELLKGMGIGGLTGAGLGTGAGLASGIVDEIVNPSPYGYNSVSPSAIWLAGGLGSIAGGVKGAIDHAQKRQRAIERLKELGVTDSPVK